MSLSAEARRLHDEYENSISPIPQAVDEAYAAARAVLVEAGFSVSNSDPAEELVAYIYKYVIDSAEAN